MSHKLKLIKIIRLLGLFTILSLMLNSCNGKFPGADARKFPADPKERVKKNLEEGRGITINEVFGSGEQGGRFDFASSNELWRASLDVIDFMPLASANYSGGMIITDWFTDSNNSGESIKITIRFLTNEIRSDALNIKIFYKTCSDSNKCLVSEKSGPLSKELKKEILKLATKYKKEDDVKNFKPYIPSDPSD